MDMHWFGSLDPDPQGNLWGSEAHCLLRKKVQVYQNKLFAKSTHCIKGSLDLCAKNVIYYTESTRFVSRNLYQSTEPVQMNPDLQNTKYRVKSAKNDYEFVSQL